MPWAGEEWDTGRHGFCIHSDMRKELYTKQPWSRGEKEGPRAGIASRMAEPAREERGVSMWYVIQTMTGKEQEAADAIDRVLAGSCYERCFIIRRECVWRLEGRLRVHVEPLFPSYVFAEIDETKKAGAAGELFHALKRVPRLTRLLGGADGTGGAGGAARVKGAAGAGPDHESCVFQAVESGEEQLFKEMAQGDKDFIIRRSPVKVDEDGKIIWAGGALTAYTDRIVKKRLRKRYIVVEIPFLGSARRVQMGIRLEGDP
ncbi:hypothetical protein D3Z50_13775 [Clostridiaceae bacterium]|nr:hypothetical protein [Clostridiaceae bacterium]